MSTVADLDYDAALQRMAGMSELYREALQLFLHDGPPLLHRIGQLLQQQQWQQARYAAHTLKTSAALLGAQALSQAAETLEESLATAVPQALLLGQAEQRCRYCWQRFSRAAKAYC